MSTICGQTAHSVTRLKASRFLVACAVVLLGVDARGQSEPFGGEDPFENLDALTPQALIAAIEANNPDLHSVAAAAEAAAFRIEPAGALADPTLDYGQCKEVGYAEQVRVGAPGLPQKITASSTLG